MDAPLDPHELIIATVLIVFYLLRNLIKIYTIRDYYLYLDVNLYKLQSSTEQRSSLPRKQVFFLF